MKVQNLIKLLQDFERSEGDFEVYVLLQKEDDSEGYFEIEGITLNSTDSNITFHCLMIKEEDEYVIE
jgi:hypothetical protein